MTIAYSELRTKVRARAFPDLVPENLSAVVDQTIQDALSFLYKHVPTLEGETVRDLTATDAICSWGNSHVFCAPDDRLTLVYTYLPGIRGSEIYLDEEPYADFLAWNRRVMSEGTTRAFRETAFNFLTGEPTPLAFTSTTPAERASVYNYARFNGRIYVYPALGSNERIVFRAEKRPSNWYSSDLVDGSPEFQRAVTLYLQKENALYWDRDPQAAQIYDREYRDAVAELIWQKEYTQRIQVVRPPHGRGNWPAPDTDTTATSGTGIGGGDFVPCDSNGWPAAGVDAKWILTALGRLYGKNLDTDEWSEVTLVGSDSAPSLEIGAPTSAPTGGSGNTGWPAIPSSGSVILTTGGDLYTKNTDDSLWHSVTIYDSGAEPAFELSAPGANAPTANTGSASWPNFPASSRWILTRQGIMSGKNLDTGKWHKVTAVGDTATPSLQLSAPGTANP